MIYCSHCKNSYDETATAYCPFCGAPAVFYPPTPPSYYEDPAIKAQKKALARTILILGIVALALALEIAPLAGWIVGAIALKKAAEYEQQYGVLDGMARIGRNLAKPAKIVGIVMAIGLAVVFTLYIFAFVTAVLAGSSFEGSSLF